MGRPSLYLTAESISSIVPSPISTAQEASLDIVTKILFTMNPGTSFLTCMIILSIFLAKSSTILIVSSLVFSPHTISRSFRILGGLKKCIPINFSGLLVASASFVMLREDVLVANIVWSGQYCSISLKTFFLRSNISGIASMTRSASFATSIRSAVASILFSTFSGSSEM